MKNLKNPKMLKIRIIVSSILLTLFIAGWIAYGVTLFKTNARTILVKFYNTNDVISLFDKFEFKDNYMNFSYENGNIGLFRDGNNNLLYLYNKGTYYDVSAWLKDYGLIINKDEFYNRDNYKKIIKEIHNIIIDRYNYVEEDSKYLEKSDLYVYNYIFNTSYLVLSMGGNKEVMSTLSEMFNASSPEIQAFLDQFKDRRLNYSIYTKGSNRDIVYYSVKLDGLFSVTYKDGIVSGYVSDMFYELEGDKFKLHDDYVDLDLVRTDSVEFDAREFNEIQIETISDLFGLSKIKVD